MSNVTTLDAPSASKAADAKSAKGAALKPVTGAGEFSGKRSLISISINKEDGGSDAVFVGAGGVGFQIPRGKQWEVPREVAEGLTNAVEFSYPPGLPRVESPRFSFTRIDLPDPV